MVKTIGDLKIHQGFIRVNVITLANPDPEIKDMAFVGARDWQFINGDPKAFSYLLHMMFNVGKGKLSHSLNLTVEIDYRLNRESSSITAADIYECILMAHQELYKWVHSKAIKTISGE